MIIYSVKLIIQYCLIITSIQITQAQFGYTSTKENIVIRKVEQNPFMRRVTGGDQYCLLG